MLLQNRTWLMRWFRDGEREACASRTMAQLRQPV